MASEGWVWMFRFGVLFVLLGALLFLISFCTTRWWSNDVIEYGLWERCTGAECGAFDPLDIGDYFVATQVLQCSALAFYALSPIFHFFCYVAKKYPDKGCRTRIFDIGHFTGNICHISSVLCYGLVHSTPEYFSWSFNMSAAAAGISTFGVIVMAVSRSKALNGFSFKHKRSNSAQVGVIIINNTTTNINTNVSNSNSPRVTQTSKRPGVDTGYFQRRGPPPPQASPQPSQAFVTPAPYQNQNNYPYGQPGPSGAYPSGPPMSDPAYPPQQTGGFASAEPKMYPYSAPVPSAPPSSPPSYDQSMGQN